MQVTHYAGHASHAVYSGHISQACHAGHESYVSYENNVEQTKNTCQ